MFDGEAGLAMTSLRSKQGDDLHDHGGRQLDAPREHVTELSEHDFTPKELMLGQNRPQDIRAKAPGRKSGDQDVRVEEDPHEISRKTSSSVR